MLASLASFTYAQKSVEGYLITLQNDTLRGDISNRGDFQTTQSVTFTAANGSQSKTYTPKDIKGFAIGEYTYESMDVKSAAQEGRYFAWQILNGYTSLYEVMIQPGKPIYLFRKNDGSLVVLEEMNYFGLLKYHLSDCPAIQFNAKALQRYLYRSSHLQDLLARYNQCVAPQAKQSTTKTKYAFHYGVLLGAGLHRYQNLDYVHGGDYGRNASPTGGGFLSASLGRFVETEVQLLYNYSHGYLNKGPYYSYGDETYEFKAHALAIPLIVRFYIAEKFFISPGFTVNKVVKQTGKEVTYGLEYPFVAYPGNSSLGFMGGLGIRFRLLNKVTLLEVRYSDGIARKGVAQEAKTTNIQLLLRMALK